MGIAEDDQARIFDDFVQLGNPERDRGKGLGLGLAIARRLAELQESRIRLDSKPGRGSRFSFDLAPAEPAEEPLRIGAAPDLVAGLRLLLIDDDPAVRDSTGLLLRQWGVSVALADDVAEAEGLMAGVDPFDICLSDYRLPGSLTGLDVIARLKAGAGAPRAFALLTGDMDPGLLEAADAAGIVIVHKPAQPARLRALLNHLAQA
jgi:CheY-like chemotaxis protein